MQDISGIYKLSFKGTHKVYIGQSKNIHKRFGEHVSSFKTGCASKKLADAYNLYGQPLLDILVEIPESGLTAAEKVWIHYYNSVSDGFNSMDCTHRVNTHSGESSYNAKHTNEQYAQVLKLLSESTIHGFEYISKITEVPVSIVAAISSGFSHTWLQEEYPYEWNIAQSRNGNRRELKNLNKSTVAKTGAYTEQQYLDVLKLLVANPRPTGSKISELTGVNISTIADIRCLRRHSWLKLAAPEHYNTLEQLKLNRKK